MDVLIVYCDSEGPSRYLRYLEIGVLHQVLTDGQLKTATMLMHADMSVEELLHSVAQHAARLCVFYFDEHNGAWTHRVIEALRGQFPDTPVCALGVGATLAPEAVMGCKPIDYMIVGEAEIALYELATQLARGAEIKGVRNLWWRDKGQVSRNPLRPLQENLDLLPYADRSLFAQQPYRAPGDENVLHVFASRGCPYECLFCYSPVVKRAYEGKGNYYRMRSPQHLVGEILGELRRRPYSFMRFCDEIFPTDKSWLRTLAQRLGGSSPLPFEVTLPAEKCDAEVLDLLKSCGCTRVCFGVETGNEGFRKRIASRNLGNERLQAAVAAARERSISVITTNMIGLPLESEPLIQETCSLNQGLAPDEIRCTVYQAVEGTSLHTYARDKQYLVAAPREPSARADFTQMSLRLPEVSPEHVRKYLHRMHFLNLGQKLRRLAPAQGYVSFLHELPRAKFQLARSAAIDVGLSRRGASDFGYLAIENGSSCRFTVSLRERSALKFALLVPQASMRRLADARCAMIAEIALVRKDGAEQPVFYRAVVSSDPIVSQTWHDCVEALPQAEAEPVEMVFRVFTLPHCEVKACVFWGNPVLAEQRTVCQGGGEAIPGTARQEYEATLAGQQREINLLRAQLKDLGARETALREERDEKAKRIGELHVKLLEAEKHLSEKHEGELQREESTGGIAGKLKGMFRK